MEKEGRDLVYVMGLRLVRGGEDGERDRERVGRKSWGRGSGVQSLLT